VRGVLTRWGTGKYSILSELLKKARKYFQSPRDVWLFLKVALFIAVLPIYLRRYGMVEILEKMTPERQKNPADREKLTVYVNWWLNRDIAMFKPTCMRRSLVLYRMLGEAGINVTIHYGIRKNPDGSNEGHSWLSLDGVCLPPDGNTAVDYKETFRFPPDESI